MRSRFEGVRNVVRFNAPTYLAGLGVAVAGASAGLLLSGTPARIGWLAAGFSFYGLAASLVVTAWVYDLSDLYDLPFLSGIVVPEDATIVLVNAGFDEIAAIVRESYPRARLRVFDFFDVERETERSIARARRLRSIPVDTESVQPGQLPLADGEARMALAFLSAHEIRDDDRRVDLFRELERGLVPDGTVLVVEHLRNVPNLLAYGPGALHFLGRDTWLRTFERAGWRVESETSHTPFVSAFRLRSARSGS